MKWRITINWEFISPLLETASGILHLERFEKGMAIDPPDEKYSLSINVKKRSFGMKGIIPHLKPEIDGIINSMAKCYLDGLTLQQSSCHWIEEDDIIQKEEFVDE